MMKEISLVVNETVFFLNQGHPGREGPAGEKGLQVRRTRSVRCCVWL